MDTCPMCSCILTGNTCVICGYKVKNINNSSTSNNNGSVFDIFDFIDGKEELPKNNKEIYDNAEKVKQNHNIANININDKQYNKKIYEKNTYEKPNYKKQPKHKNLTKENTSDKRLEENTLNIEEIIPKINIAKIFRIFLYFIWFLVLIIQPAVGVIFILKGVLKDARKNRNKK